MLGEEGFRLQLIEVADDVCLVELHTDLCRCMVSMSCHGHHCVSASSQAGKVLLHAQLSLGVL